MAAYLIRRLWQMIPTLIGVVLLVFFLFKAFGGDPAEILGGLSATPEQVNAIRTQLGLNEPWWVQLSSVSAYANLSTPSPSRSRGGAAGPPTRRPPTWSRRACRPR